MMVHFMTFQTSSCPVELLTASTTPACLSWTQSTKTRVHAHGWRILWEAPLWGARPALTCWSTEDPLPVFRMQLHSLRVKVLTGGHSRSMETDHHGIQSTRNSLSQFPMASQVCSLVSTLQTEKSYIQPSSL